MLAQLWCLLALAAVANATPVASSVSKIAIADASAAAIAVTKTLRDVSRAARATPVASERRGLIESNRIGKVDISMCTFLKDSFGCALESDSANCRVRSGCSWGYDSDSGTYKCTASFAESTFESQLEAYVGPQIDRCDEFDDDASACAMASNCETTVGCTPTKTFIDSVVTDPVTAEVTYATLLCAPIQSVAECDSREECAYDRVDGECGMSDESSRRILHAFVHECDFDEEIAEAATLAQDIDLCPVSQAQIECKQITTEATCNTNSKCEWDDPDGSIIAEISQYPCAVKDQHLEPLLDVMKISSVSLVQPVMECQVTHTDEATCEGDEECEWKAADNKCGPNDVKMFRALSNTHPHFPHYYQVDATCGFLDESTCLSAADKCVWSEASVGDDAECFPTVKTLAERMSCVCPAEVAAVAPNVDTSSADCSLPEFVSAASRVAGSAFLATAAAAAAALVVFA